MNKEEREAERLKIQENRRTLIYDFCKVKPADRVLYEQFSTKLMWLDYLDLEEKYQKLLKFVKELAWLTMDDEDLEAEIYCGSIEDAIIAKKSRDLLKEIGEL